MPTEAELVAWSTFVVAILTALSRIGAVWSTAKDKSAKAASERDAAGEGRFEKVWDKQDQMMEDLRKENAALKEECTKLRVEVAQAWSHADRRGESRDRSK